MRPLLLTNLSPKNDFQGSDLPTVEDFPLKVKRAGIVSRMLHGTGAGAFAYGLGITSNLLLLLR